MADEDKKKVARPWDMLNKNIGRVSEELKEKRMAICQGCEFYIALTHQCTKCGCIMNLKTQLPHAECPEGKWFAYNEENIGFKSEEDIKENPED